MCAEAELSRRNSEDSAENIPLSKKTVVVLKKELAQKTEALNKALKRENELKVSGCEAAAMGTLASRKHALDNPV